MISRETLKDDLNSVYSLLSIACFGSHPMKAGINSSAPLPGESDKDNWKTMDLLPCLNDENYLSL